MLKKIKNWLIALIFGTAVLAAGSQIVFSKPQEQLLKAPKEKILAHENRIINKEIEVKGKKEIIEEEIISYDYITERKAVGKFRFGKDNFTNVQILSEEDDKITERFWSGDSFYKDKNGDIYEIEKGATTTPELFEEATKLSLLEKIFFKSANAEGFYVGSGDGLINGPNLPVSWDDCRSASSGSSVSYAGTTATAKSSVSTWSSGYLAISRAYFPVDTSAMGAGATITSATFYVYASSKDNDITGDPDSAMGLVQTSQADATELVTADYNDMGSTEGSSNYRTINSIATDAYTSFALNATGLSWIDPTGYTLLGIRSGQDLKNATTYLDNYNTPASPWYNAEVAWYTSEETGTNKDPYLDITYTPGASDDALMFNMDF